MDARKTALAVILGAAFGLGGCSKPESAQVGKDVGNVNADTATLRTASAAVNEVVRNAADCELARPLIPKANSSLDEAAKQIRTATGRATLDALRSQIRPVQEACGS
jgi:hypothetical protein